MVVGHPAVTILQPAQDRWLERCFVVPPLMGALLDGRSTLVMGQDGHGKSAVAWMGRRWAATEWLNVGVDVESTLSPAATLIPAIVQGMWERIEQDPSVLVTLGVRRTAIRYFLDAHLEVKLEYQLPRLAELWPQFAHAIDELQATQSRELFQPHASDAVRIETLCDCVQALNLHGVFIWIDVGGATTIEDVPLLYTLFDTVSLMRKRRLHFKCLVPPVLYEHLLAFRSVSTLSVDLQRIYWTQNALVDVIDARLNFVHQEIAAIPPTLWQLAERIGAPDVDAMVAFLAQYADDSSPSDWIALAGCGVAALHERGAEPPAALWRRTRRAFFEHRLPLSVDADGMFWRGRHRIDALIPRKRALYKLAHYLYEHPGFQPLHRIAAQMDTDQSNLSTMVHRLRKEFLEPVFDGEAPGDERPIYLVTDAQDKGYELRNTARRQGGILKANRN